MCDVVSDVSCVMSPLQYYPDYRSLLHLHHEAIRAAGYVIDDEYVYTQTPLDEL